MKFLLAASALLLCLACAREELGTDDRIAGGSNNASEMIFSAVSPSTKTMMGESVEGKRPVYWSEGDKICVNGVVSDPLEGVSENATAVVFRVGSGLDAPFKGLYPASFYTDASTITLPSVQTWENGSFANGSFPMASYTQDQREEMAFRFLCSMLKLSIKQDSTQDTEADGIASVVFRGNDGEQVSGAFTIDYQNATLASTSSSDNDKIVGMIVNQPLSADKALDIYLVVPARVYDAGFTLSITDAQGRVMKKASNKSQTLKAGIIAKLPEFVFVPNAEGGDDPIPEDLIPKDGDVTEDGEPVVMYFGARIDNGEGDKEGTKTHLGTPSDGKYPNLWTVGDKVAINGVASASLPEANISNEGKRARFPMAQRVDKCAGYYYVGYPYTDGTTSGFTGFSDGAGTVVIPTEQAYTAGTYDPRAFVLIGKSTTQVMTFTPKMALLRVTPTNSDTPYAYKISKVRLESIGGEAMSGTFTTNFENSFEATSGVSYIEINAPTDDGLDFGTPFFFMIPAQTYTKGLRFIVYTKDGKSMTFSNGSSYTAAYGSSRSISSPKYTPSVSGSVSCDFLTSSSAGFSWSGGNASNNVKKPWRLAIYNDEECSSLKVAYNISETGEADGDVWYQQEGTPHYIVGGLTPGTTYYCQVTDVNNNIAMEPISFTTDSFTPIAPSSPVGSVLLAENFGEFGHGSATLGGYSGHRYAGWAPRSTSSISNSVNCAAPTGEVTTGVSLPHDVQLRMVEGFDFTTAPRFYAAGWGFTADALDLEEGDDKETIPSVYSQPGAIRFGKSNNHRIFLVLPALTGISNGKYATVDVTIKASRTVARDISQNNQLAVFLEDDLSMTNTDQRLYGTPSLTRAYPITMTKYGYDSEVNTVRIDGVQNTDHLIIGTYANVNERNRFQIYSVTVTRVSESDVETFDITDDVSLRTFYARVDDGGSGEKSLNAKVLADVTASSTTISGWTPLDGYTGTLDGQDHSGANHTITGLTKPFFADLQGTVQNLTLNSTVSITDRALNNDALAIFAETLTGGTISYCTSAGSVTYTPSEAIANGTREVAGLVGYAKSGTITHCTNSATISVPDNGVSNDAIIEAAGLVGRLGNGTSTSVSCSDLTNNGSVSIGIDATGTNKLYSRLGGVIAYVVNRKTDNLDLPRFTNNGSVEFSGKSGRYIAVGGVVGEVHTSSKSTGSNWTNTNAVSVTSTARATYKDAGSVNDIIIGGIVGIQGFALSNCTNTGTVTNEGTFTSTKANICIGGIAGNNYGKAVSNCKNETTGSLANSGKVSNSGAGTVIAIGGVSGWSGASSSYSSTCYNKGDILNTGNGAEATAGVRIGGLVGCADGNNNMSGGNYNQGAVTEQSSTATSYVAIGGVCGFANNASTTLASAQNKSAGTITLSLASKTITNAYVGGVLGYAGAACSLSGASNAAPINAITTTTADLMYLGGVLGYTASANTLSNISNSGALTINNLTCSTSLYTGGLVGYNGGGTISGTANNAATGDMDITMKSTGPSYIGGLAGYSSGAITGTNRGDVAVKKYSSYSCADSLNIGGIVGFQAANLTGCSNYGAISNTNPVSSSVNINIGGVSGCNNGYQLSACSNQTGASVANSAAADSLSVGGLVGRSKAGSTYVSTCFNKGFVSNSGNATNRSRVGGLIGIAIGANTLTSTKTTYNYNDGPVEDSSSSDVVSVGGVCGATFGDASFGFAFCRNLSSGIVKLGAGTPRNAHISGILALADDYSNVTLTSVINSGAITINGTTVTNILAIGGVLALAAGPFPSISGTSADPTTNNGSISFTSVTLEKALRLGGVWGWRDNTNEGAVQYCTNTGSIVAESGGLVTSYDSFNFVGGVIGGGGGSSNATVNMTVQNCYNSASRIYMNFKGRILMGGIIASVQTAPAHCSNSANLSLKRTPDPKSWSAIGGIAGYQVTGTRTFVDLHQSGTINAGETTYCYASGIIGYTNGNSTFNACSVEGSISCKSYQPGLFFGPPSGTTRTITFKNGCTVKSGTVHSYTGTSPETTTTIRSMSDITGSILVGGGGTGTTTFTNLSVN